MRAVERIAARAAEARAGRLAGALEGRVPGVDVERAGADVVLTGRGLGRRMIEDAALRELVR